MAADDPSDTPPEGQATTTATEVEFATEQDADGTRRFYLAGGRSLTVTPATGSDEIVELRNPSGLLELRVKLTADGPVLQVESMKLQIKAADTVSIDCKKFDVHATEGVTVKTEGSLDLHSEQEAKLSSPEDVRIVGKVIWLN